MLTYYVKEIEILQILDDDIKEILQATTTNENNKIKWIVIYNKI